MFLDYPFSKNLGLRTINSIKKVNHVTTVITTYELISPNSVLATAYIGNHAVGAFIPPCKIIDVTTLFLLLLYMMVNMKERAIAVIEYHMNGIPSCDVNSEKKSGICHMIQTIPTIKLDMKGEYLF